MMEGSTDGVSVEFHPKTLDFGNLKEKLLYCQNLTITLKGVDLYDLRAYSQKPRAFIHIKMPKDVHVLDIESKDTHKYLLRIGICQNIPEDWKKEKMRLEMYDSEERMSGEESENYHKIDIDDEILVTLNDNQKFSVKTNAMIFDSSYYHTIRDHHSERTKIFSSMGLEYIENNPQSGYHVEDNTLLLLFPTSANLMYFEERNKTGREQKEQGEEEVAQRKKRPVKSYEEVLKDKIDFLEQRREKYEPRSWDILKLSIFEQRLNKIHPYNYTSILIERIKKVNPKMKYLEHIRQDECLQQCRNLVLEKNGEAGLPYIRSSDLENSVFIKELSYRLGLVNIAVSSDEEKVRNYHNVRYEGAAVGSSIASFLSPVGFEMENSRMSGHVLKNGCFSATVTYLDRKSRIGVFTRTIYDMLLISWNPKEFGRFYQQKSQEEEEEQKKKGLASLEGFFTSHVDDEIMRICRDSYDKINEYILEGERMKEIKIDQITNEYFNEKYNKFQERQQQQEEQEEEQEGEGENAKLDDNTMKLFSRMFKENENIDGLFAPSTKVSANKIGAEVLVSNGIEHQDPLKVQLENSMILSLSGYPCVNIPVGFNKFNNIPIGITCVGRDEKSLFQILKRLSLIF